jgi:hypothetical protein
MRGMQNLPVTSLDQKTHIRIHERYGHSDVFPVRQHGTSVRPPLFDRTKYVVPSKNTHVSEQLTRPHGGATVRVWILLTFHNSVRQNGF